MAYTFNDKVYIGSVKNEDGEIGEHAGYLATLKDWKLFMFPAELKFEGELIKLIIISDRVTGEIHGKVIIEEDREEYFEKLEDKKFLRKAFLGILKMMSETIPQDLINHFIHLKDSDAVVPEPITLEEFEKRKEDV